MISSALMRQAGALMRAERLRLGVSLKALALDLEISSSYLSDMEAGNRRYSRQWQSKAAKALGISLPKGIPHLHI